MTIIKEDDKSYLIRCECGHRIRQPKLGNDLVKCYSCGLQGKIKKEFNFTDIKIKQPNLSYVFGEKEIA